MTDSILTLQVVRIKEESPDTKTFYFQRTDGQPLIYKAGQFLTFIIELNGREIRRSYSMSSAPGVDEMPAITIKRVPNGEASRFWIDLVKEGDFFNALSPSGRFVLDDTLPESRDIFLIGAGSGITPLFSILKEVLLAENGTFITLIYASKNVRNTLFWNEILALQTRFSHKFQVIHIHSQPEAEWTGIRGRINNTRLEQLVSKSLRHAPDKARFFICGPFELMRSVGITLHFMGFSKEQIRKENFVIAPAPPPPPVSDPHNIILNFRGTLHNLHVPAHATVLDAALSAGIMLPYSCKGGRCSTCAGICTSGKLHMTVNEVLTDKDLAEGWVLTCSSYVDDDHVVIEIP